MLTTTATMLQDTRMDHQRSNHRSLLSTNKSTGLVEVVLVSRKLTIVQIHMTWHLKDKVSCNQHKINMVVFLIKTMQEKKRDNITKSMKIRINTTSQLKLDHKR